jgi:hypothetical protein
MWCGCYENVDYTHPQNRKALRLLQMHQKSMSQVQNRKALRDAQAKQRPAQQIAQMPGEVRSQGMKR